MRHGGGEIIKIVQATECKAQCVRLVNGQHSGRFITRLRYNPETNLNEGTRSNTAKVTVCKQVSALPQPPGVSALQRVIKKLVEPEVERSCASTNLQYTSILLKSIITGAVSGGKGKKGRSGRNICRCHGNGVITARVGLECRFVKGAV